MTGWPFGLCANVSTMFTEEPFLQRFKAARAAGFTAVEMQYPYAQSAKDIALALDDAGLELVLFNSPAGDRDKGGPGSAALPGREAEFRDQLGLALDYAALLKPRFLHILAGRPDESCPPEQIRDLLRENLLYATEASAEIAPETAEGQGLCFLLEALNHQDMPGYAFGSQAELAAFLRAADLPRLGLQFDTWHAFRAGEDILRSLTDCADVMRHLQISAPPDRREPSEGQLPFAALFEWLRRQSYDGFIGCEYTPSGRTGEGLGWIADYGLCPALRHPAGQKGRRG